LHRLRKNLTEELNEPRHLSPPERTRPALFVPRAARALVGGRFRLAFWSPWLFWIAIVLGGATISRELHPWVGLVFIVGVSLMYSMCTAR
jgi:hypothetical protein